jgi:hypothetical protein
MVFKFFCIFNVSQNTFKFLIASMKSIPYYGYFTGSRIRIPHPTPPFPPHPPTKLAATQRNGERQFIL